MGRPKVKIIDDSQEEVEKKTSNKKAAKATEVKSETSESVNKQSLRSDDLQTSNIQSQNPASNIKHPASKSTKPGKTRLASQAKQAKPRSKKYQEKAKDLDKTKAYSLSEAVDLVKKLSYTKFNATLEAHINTAQTGIRGLVSLPFASGRKLRILAFGKDADTSGADVLGSEEVIEDINKGKINFDLVVTTPEWMPKLAKVARILGPRGLMPNPKNGTITQDLKKAIEGFQAGKTEYKTEPKAPVIHLAVGKVDQPNEELTANIKTLVQTLGKTRVKKVTLSPTMGPSVKVDLASI